jgi:hypothetical protein
MAMHRGFAVHPVDLIAGGVDRMAPVKKVEG